MTRRLLAEGVRSVRVVSRDEAKHAQMAAQFRDGRIRYLIGDVRDRDRLLLAFDGADVVINAAALKRIDACQRDPREAIRTNVYGADNVLHAARERGVERCLQVSTDKVPASVSTYGSTKALSEALFVDANCYAPGRMKTAVVRYGNVTGSRGSLVPMLLELRDSGEVPLTDPQMTRYWMTMGQAVELVVSAVENMEGGETVVPKLPSVWVTDIITAIAPNCRVKRIGLRGRERLYEVLVTPEESRTCEIRGGHFVIRPATFEQAIADVEEWTYRSDTNDWWLGVDDIRAGLEAALKEAA